MHLHLVGGFLGSGKTTAIKTACERLEHSGQRASVVTNDQGSLLVDTALLAAGGIPTLEVTGGCFCCEYPQLVQQIETLARAGAQHVFAEAVGSCVDVMATVVHPLVVNEHVPLEALSFTVLADARLLARLIKGDPLPWSPDICYLFIKQLEEAPVLVAGKIDLLDAAHHLAPADLRAALEERFPGKRVLVQDSRQAEQVEGWLQLIAGGMAAAGGAGAPLEVDYDRYGAAEAALAWDNREIRLTGVRGQGTAVARAIIAGIMQRLRRVPVAVGHVKFLVRDNHADGKISFTGVEGELSSADSERATWQLELPVLVDDELYIVVNARVELAATALSELIDAAVEDAVAAALGAGSPLIAASTGQHESFHPAYPQPVHRITEPGR